MGTACLPLKSLIASIIDEVPIETTYGPTVGAQMQRVGAMQCAKVLAEGDAINGTFGLLLSRK